MARRADESDQLFLSWPVAPGPSPTGSRPRSCSTRSTGAPGSRSSPSAWSGSACAGSPHTWAQPVREVNCLTYVRLGDERAVWFFRIDVASRLAAIGRLFALPYHHSVVTVDAEVDCRVRSEGRGAGRAIGPSFARATADRPRARGAPGHARAFPGGALRHVFPDGRVHATPRDAGQAAAPDPRQRGGAGAEHVPRGAGSARAGRQLAAWCCRDALIRTWPPTPVSTRVSRPGPGGVLRPPRGNSMKSLGLR